ncbi:MAG: hypothetical protein L0154_26495 [Chloroflexi bacterium]|nr:hypothetical protein [Chloroflexota bacterium]
MAADFKSHVLRRDEKGLLGIPFKRWLLSGVTGGLCFALGGIFMGGFTVVVAVGVAMSVLILTGQRHGMPLWLRWSLGLRGRLILLAARQPDGLAARLSETLDLPVSAITVIDGDALFAPPDHPTLTPASQWVSRPEALSDDDLVFVEGPLDDHLLEVS